MTLPVIGILAIAATACQGVGLTEARQAVDNQRAINEIEDRELRPIEQELQTLYDAEMLPRERELEDLWNQVQNLENGDFKQGYDSSLDPWAPGGAASRLQQEFNEKYAEIDRLYRELDVESRRIQIEQQFGTTSYGIDPAVAAVEDERFALQRQLDRLHQFGRRPIEDLYLQMNEMNASNGWSQTDIYAADDLNRQIADIQNQIANAYSTGAQFNDQNQQELFAIENELNFLRADGFVPINELHNRIAELEQKLAAGDATTAGVVVNADGTVSSDSLAEIQRLENEMAEATQFLRGELDRLNADLQANSAASQAEIDALLAQSVTTVDPAVVESLQAEIDSLLQEIANKHAATDAAVTAIDVQVADLSTQIGDLYQLTDTGNAELQTQIDSLNAEIDALDSTAADYADVKAGLEDQIAVLQNSIELAIASEAATVADLQAQRDVLTAQKATELDNESGVVANLQLQIDAKQAELNTANAGTTSTTAISQEVQDQISVIELNRDEAASAILAEIDSATVQIQEIEADYLAKIGELNQFADTTPATGSVAGFVPVDTTEIQFEIQTLRDQALKLENDLGEKIRVLEERRNKLQTSLDGVVAGGIDVAALEAKLVLLHDQLNALQNSGIDASRNYNIMMEELQNKAVRLEKELSLEIRALEDQIWEIDGRIAELYRSNNNSSFDPYAQFNERLKQIELDRFELEQRRWALDDEQQIAFNQFNNFGSEQQAELDAKRNEVLGPLYARIDVLEQELRELRLTQREIEDRLRDAQRLVDEKIRELESQTLELIDDAVTAAEEGAESLGALENGDLQGLDLSLLDELDTSVIDPEATAAQPAQ